MYKTIQNITFILFILTPITALSQGEWKLYNEANSGIGDNFVEDIVVDEQGVIWIAGWDVLSRFNGLNWLVFEIPHHIQDLELMNSGNLLLATTQGLYEFDTEDYKLSGDLNSNIPFNYLECVSVDDNDNIWIGYNRIAYFNGISWVEHSSSFFISPTSKIYSIDCFQNHVWAGVGISLQHFDGNTWEGFHEWNSPIPGGLLLEVKCDSTGKVWIGSSAGTISQNYGRLLTYDQTNWTATDSSDCSFLWNGVSSVAFLDSTYWFTSNWNGFVYDDLTTYYMYDENNTIIPTHYAYVVATDKQRNVFMGTEEGLVVYNETKINIDAYKYEDLFVCYPVPVTNILNISFILEQSQMVKIELFNSNGSQVIRQYRHFESGRNIHELNTINLMTGVYFVRLSYGNKSEVKKIVKMN